MHCEQHRLPDGVKQPAEAEVVERILYFTFLLVYASESKKQRQVGEHWFNNPNFKKAGTGWVHHA